jgi:hypothetical protein
MKRATLAISALAAVAVTAGCTLVSPNPQAQGLNYSDGPIEGKAFVECSTSGEKNADDAFNDHYFYPKGQRTFAFSNDKGADSKPLSVATKDSVELVARGTVTFHLNVSCKEYTDSDGTKWPGGRMQKFHEQFGSKKYDGQVAYSEDEDESNGGPGWQGFVNVYVKSVVERAMDSEGTRYPWPDLYANADKRQLWEQAVVKAVPKLIAEELGGDLLIVDSIVIQKPDVPPALRTELENNEAARLAAQTAETNKTAAKSWPGGIEAYLAYQRAIAVTKAIESGKVKILPIPEGSPVIVSPGN